MKVYPNITAVALMLNPEPWAMGTISVVGPARKKFPKVSPDKTLKAYQDALFEELNLRGASILPGPYYSVKFTFSRQLVSYKRAEGGTSSRNWADVTNMQKGTEDALQGVYMPNDRAVIRVQSALAGFQSKETLPWVVIEIRHSIDEFTPVETAICPEDQWFSPAGQEAYNEMLKLELGGQDITDNEWEP